MIYLFNMEHTHLLLSLKCPYRKIFVSNVTTHTTSSDLSISFIFETGHSHKQQMELHLLLYKRCTAEICSKYKLKQTAIYNTTPWFIIRFSSSIQMLESANCKYLISIRDQT